MFQARTQSKHHNLFIQKKSYLKPLKSKQGVKRNRDRIHQRSLDRQKTYNELCLGVYNFFP